MDDDLSSFATFQKQKALELGEAREVFNASKQLVVELNEYAYPYQWTWFGIPIIQLPADIMATQEAIWAAQPDIIIETGIARGGSLIFAATILQAMGKGRVIGVDVDIRAHNRKAIEDHHLSHLITMIEGSSTSAETLEAVRAQIPEGARVLVILDSDHSCEHVLAECRAYGPLVTQDSYLIVADTLLGYLDQEETPTERAAIWYQGDEPLAAANQYLAESGRFERDQALNSKLVLSSSPGGYLKCTKA